MNKPPQPMPEPPSKSEALEEISHSIDLQLLHTYAVRTAEAAGGVAIDMLKRRSFEPNGSTFIQEWPVTYVFTAQRGNQKLAVRITVEDRTTYDEQLALDVLTHTDREELRQWAIDSEERPVEGVSS